MSITSSLKDKNVWVKDVTQAYIQEYDLESDAYMKLSMKFQLPRDICRKHLKPLYELLEYRDSWFRKFENFLQKDCIKTDSDPRTMTLHYITKQNNTTKTYKKRILYMLKTLRNLVTSNS